MEKLIRILTTEASGKLGDLVFFRNAFGQTVRPFVPPTNNNTDAQAEARAAMTNASRDWQTKLTNAQRAAWETYARNTPLTDRLGQSHNTTGRNMFIRAFVPSQIGGVKKPTDAPTTFRHNSIGPVSAVSTGDEQGVFMTVDVNAEWATNDDGAMIIAAGPSRPPTHNFFATPFSFAAVIEGDASGLVNPIEIEIPTVIFEPNVFWIKVRTLTADRRYSAPRTLRVVSTVEP